MNELFVLIAVSALSAFIVNLLIKWGFVMWLQVHGNDFFSKLANCHFCISWWVNVIVCIIIAIALRDWRFLFLPFFSTVITKFMI